MVLRDAEEVIKKTMFNFPSTEDIEQSAREARDKRRAEFNAKFPPFDEFIGRVVAVNDIEHTWGEQVTHTMEVVVQPLNIVVPFQTGTLNARWRVSSNPRSVYAISRKLLDQALRLAHNNPSYVLRDPNDLVGVVLTWREVLGDDVVWSSMNPQYRPKDRVLIPTGAPVQGWEATIPADIETRQLAARELAASKARDRAAQNGNYTPATTLTPETVVPSVALSAAGREALVKFLHGRGGKITDIILDALNDSEMKRHKDAIDLLKNRTALEGFLAEGAVRKNAEGVFESVVAA